MKKLLLWAISVALLLSLCACGRPNVEDCVLNANTFMSSYKPVSTNGCYRFLASYRKTDNAYCVVMQIDKDELNARIAQMDIEDKYIDLVTQTTINYYDQDTETISTELKLVKENITPLFDGTDVSVVVGYADDSGEITQLAE